MMRRVVLIEMARNFWRKMKWNEADRAVERRRLPDFRPRDGQDVARRACPCRCSLSEVALLIARIAAADATA